MQEQNIHRKTIVNSWNEWDPLKHVIVGRADGTMVQAPEPAIERNWPDHGFPLGTYGRGIDRSTLRVLFVRKTVTIST